MVETQRLNLIGKTWTKVDAMGMVIGETRYADDLHLPHMLYCKILRSRHPHALIKHVDLGPALARAGVLAAISGHDLPIKYGILPVSQDEEALCVGCGRCGQACLAGITVPDVIDSVRRQEVPK